MSKLKVAAYGLVVLYAIATATFLIQDRAELMRQDPRLLAHGN